MRAAEKIDKIWLNILEIYSINISENILEIYSRKEADSDINI